MKRSARSTLTVSLALCGMAGMGGAQSRALRAEDIASSPTLRRLEILLVGPQPSRDELAGALGALLSGDDRIVVRQEDTQPAPQESGPLSFHPPGIWIEMSDAGRVRIVAIAAERPPAVREVQVERPTQVGVEVIAQIVQQTAHALLATEERKEEANAVVPPHAPTPPTTAPSSPSGSIAFLAPSPSQRDHRYQLAVNLGYVTRTIFEPNSDSPLGMGSSAHGIAGSLAIIMPGRRVRRYGALMVDQTRISTNATGGNYAFPALDITSTSARAMVGLALQPVPAIELAVGAGAGLDRIAAEAGDTGAEARLIAGGRGSLRLSYLLPIWGLEVLGLLTVDMSPRVSFTQASIIGSSPVYTKRIRPGTFIGFGWRQ